MVLDWGGARLGLDWGGARLGLDWGGLLDRGGVKLGWC